MKSALIALDPSAQESETIRGFLEILSLFKSKHIFSLATFASVIDPAQFSAPAAVYRELKNKYAKETYKHLSSLDLEPFELAPIHVITADTIVKEKHIELLTRYARRINASALILASSDRKGLPKWFLGSFSETAALTAKIPVIIVKPEPPKPKFSKDVQFVLAIDIAIPPSARAIKWVAELARQCRASVSLIYILPKRRSIFDSSSGREDTAKITTTLEKIESALKSNSVRVHSLVLPESKSVANTISEYANDVNAWLTITTASERRGFKQLILGSTARKLLRVTSRPFLSLRLH